MLTAEQSERGSAPLSPRSSRIEVRVLLRDDATSLASHVIRHLAENGERDFYFMPPVAPHAVLATYNPALWERERNDASWQRVWAAIDDEGSVRAHAVLTSNVLAPHRCQLAAGVERSWRRRGLTLALMTEAIAWARAQRDLAWIDGWAFAHNHPVRALDYKIGFREVGRVRDVLRIDGQILDQVLMVIDLGGA